ncbi:uncharacterized protein Bfra_008923 [Botrytis fragariae]|uniref:Uncharacterized protein n=1 Tax=Botrytis fragariae TaxID=1964551 RepID=A0A8H6AQR8_9HELO|nr:uncharacterized protein Bfra_008923 [Botrytis fragariae]KAF5871897.1 hypothetical protein Bfra_008923 [Botrytis fragariae]
MHQYIRISDPCKERWKTTFRVTEGSRFRKDLVSAETSEAFWNLSSETTTASDVKTLADECEEPSTVDLSKRVHYFDSPLLT